MSLDQNELKKYGTNILEQIHDNMDLILNILYILHKLMCELVSMILYINCTQIHIKYDIIYIDEIIKMIYRICMYYTCIIFEFFLMFTESNYGLKTVVKYILKQWQV